MTARAARWAIIASGPCSRLVSESVFENSSQKGVAVSECSGRIVGLGSDVVRQESVFARWLRCLFPL